jgi:acetoin utilization deacetylase AcuC-like enzyme
LLPFKLIYHPGYDLNLGQHVFPAVKYRLIRDRLLEEKTATADDFLAPGPIHDEHVLRVHERGWVTRLRNGTLSYEEVIKLEIPYSRQMVDAFLLAAGGTLLAGERALQDRVGFNIGGGFHHAFTGHGEGFCALHDVAIAARALQHRGLVRKVMVVDCDVHHGNGTASIFAGDDSVFTLSIHQRDNYPMEKPPSDLDIHLSDGTTDAEYLGRLGEALGMALDLFQPQVVFYVAGADPYYQDQLGGLSLTIEGLRARDKLVLESALRRHAAVAVTLAGGYAMEVQDTVAIHCNTVGACAESLAQG